MCAFFVGESYYCIFVDFVVFEIRLVFHFAHVPLSEILDLHVLHVGGLDTVGLPTLMYDNQSISLVSLFALCDAIVSVAFLIPVPIRDCAVLLSRVPLVREGAYASIR